MLDFLKRFKPRSFVLENVLGLNSSSMDDSGSPVPPILDQVLEAIENMRCSRDRPLYEAKAVKQDLEPWITGRRPRTSGPGKLELKGV